jgi:hypothetical protein
MEDPAHGSAMRSFVIPFGVFFAASFCTTMVFYVSMFVFIVTSAFLRMLVHVIPAHASKFTDISIVRDNSIWAIISFGGLVVSIITVILT